MARSIYIHVPFCEARCPYCDFFTLGKAAAAAPLAERWLDVVLRELDLWIASGDLSAAQPVTTVYFGGGTPSLVSGAAMERFLNGVRERLPLAVSAEITVEMQPGTADEAKVARFAAAGVTRFSIGAQTFDADLLRRLERRHDVGQTEQLIRWAQRYGECSIDLISALPGQTLEAWKRDLAAALAFEPDHISVYELTYYPGTKLTVWRESGHVAQLDENLRIAIFEYTIGELEAHGYEHYEISNFARPGHRSRHNENYWRLGDYVGLGAGAHSFIFPHRYANPPDVVAYQRQVQAGTLPRQLNDASDEELFVLENAFMGLRLVEGLDLESFRARFGVDLLQRYAAKLDELARAGLIEVDSRRLRLTERGLVRADAVIGYLL